MVTSLKINGHYGRVLLDTGTTGRNLMSSNWAQTNNIPTRELAQPITINMAAKGSKTMAKHEATGTVEIGAGQKAKTSFLIVSIARYDAILGMPFLQENAVHRKKNSGAQRPERPRGQLTQVSFGRPNLPADAPTIR